jgi:hypothetical protein
LGNWKGWWKVALGSLYRFRFDIANWGGVELAWEEAMENNDITGGVY